MTGFARSLATEILALRIRRGISARTMQLLEIRLWTAMIKPQFRRQ